MKSLKRLSALVLILALAVSLFCSCELLKGRTSQKSYIEISGGETLSIAVGESVYLTINSRNLNSTVIVWSSSSECVEVTDEGLVTGISEGTATVSAVCDGRYDTIKITVTESENENDGTGNGGGGNTDSGDNDGGNGGGTEIEDDPLGPTEDPYKNVTKEEFYRNYSLATSYMDAYYRSQHGFLSGSLTLPGQYVNEAAYRPTSGGKYIRNTDSYYMNDGRTYVVLDSYGNIAMKIYKGGAYITLEEIAAYMYAFGGTSDNLPANYTSKKNPNPQNSIWGEYLRGNHSYFSGDTSRYPYEPVLPNISGCGGSLQYYEMDIGTTGTTTPGYYPEIYNNGTRITRGAARLVYTRQDLNRNGIYEENEVYVFYTHNHYNDFREYLNYYGGWGEMFGNMTGGGDFSSTENYNPTAYPKTAYKGLRTSKITAFDMPFYDDKKYATILFIIPAIKKNAA